MNVHKSTNISYIMLVTRKQHTVNYNKMREKKMSSICYLKIISHCHTLMAVG